MDISGTVFHTVDKSVPREAHGTEVSLEKTRDFGSSYSTVNMALCICPLESFRNSTLMMCLILDCKKSSEKVEVHFVVHIHTQKMITKKGLK